MAGTTTIRLTAQGKRALERLRASLELKTQRKVTQQEAAERAFKTVAAHPELLADEWKPTKEQVAFMNSVVGSVSLGGVDSSEIDDVLYGKRE